MKLTPISTTLLALTLSVSALAQSAPWSERRYDPPVGSKWLIVSETDTVETRPGAGDRDQHVKTRAELTINEKLPDGFRITYVNRGIEVTGTTVMARLVGDAYGAVANIPIRGRLDLAGRPVAVDNLDESKAAMRGMIAKLVARFDSNPKVAAVLREMLQGLLNVEGRDAATTYMDDLPQLAVVQNAGIKPGDVRHDTEMTPSPLGGASVKTVFATRLDSYDDKTGVARFVRKREFEKEALRDAVLAIVRRLAAAGDNKTITPKMMDMMKQVNLSVEGETVYDVDNGMTVRIDDRELTSASIMGTTLTKRQKKKVAVTRQN